MKALKNFFTMIWNFIVSLFKRNKIQAPVTRTYSPTPRQVKVVNHGAEGIRQMAKHNNRRITKGRFTQYITVQNDFGQTVTKPIYHEAR